VYCTVISAVGGAPSAGARDGQAAPAESMSSLEDRFQGQTPFASHLRRSIERRDQRGKMERCLHVQIYALMRTHARPVKHGGCST
jgi:hypothetical protein